MNSSSLQNLLGKLEQFLSTGSVASLSGISSPVSLALLMCSPEYLNLYRQPQVVVTDSDESSLALEQSLRFFNPRLRPYLLRGADSSPYSSFYPSSTSLSKRTSWLHATTQAKAGDIYILSFEALLQKSLPPDLFKEHSFFLEKGKELTPSFLKSLPLLGYQASPRAEDPGQFSVRGGLLDIFSPAHDFPIRVELFGDIVDSLRTFDPKSQRSLLETDHLYIIPARETFFYKNFLEEVFNNLKSFSQKIDKNRRDFFFDHLYQKKFFLGMDFLLPYFYRQTYSPLDFFNTPITLFYLNHLNIQEVSAKFLFDLGEESLSFADSLVPPAKALFGALEHIAPPSGSKVLLLESLHILDEQMTHPNFHFEGETFKSFRHKDSSSKQQIFSLVKDRSEKENKTIVSIRSSAQGERIESLLNQEGIPYLKSDDISSFLEEGGQNGFSNLLLVNRPLPEGLRLKDNSLLVLRESDLVSPEKKTFPQKAKKEPASSVLLMDLKAGDLISHLDFGIGQFEGLKLMSAGGFDQEFLQILYSENNRLYLPVYRINLIKKFSGQSPLSKLGTAQWKKTTSKIKNHLKDIASELLSVYAKRSITKREPLFTRSNEFSLFEKEFPYEETVDQSKAIRSILEDFEKDSPQDRLICGDVGFGKTEIAMRAAFIAAQNKKQVAVLVPTTVLCFQHFETFKARFKKWPFKIEMLSRFSSAKSAKSTINGLLTGEAHIVIGTHRLLSQDLRFKNLGLLIIDEEHKFGVAHKEKIKKLKAGVDALSMSATPIPRTLNMSLLGLRDLSLITTPPHDRLSIQTFIAKYNDYQIKSAIEAEIQRGGQVFFVHNRIKGIAELTDHLRSIAPNIRFRYAHGQMNENQLEETMVSFFKHEFDVLVCTTIIESGIDLPRANTVIINRSDTFGVSQLYQLRGRVGRSKERAFCYLLIPENGAIDPVAQERLRVLQENSDLGSGLRIAQHDLELRGAGNLLGEEQAGHISTIGYELYLELLEQSLAEAHGEDTRLSQLDPEINLRIPALIPQDYIPDVRLRMSYYNALTQISSFEDMDRFEEELIDQFGSPLPQEITNLMGIMLLKKDCQALGIRDLSLGPQNIALSFADFTPLSSKVLVDLVTGNTKKFSISPDSRLLVRHSSASWTHVHEELGRLKEFIS